MDSVTAGALLTRFGNAIAAHDRAGLRALLADDAVMHYLHTDERFAPDAFVAVVRDYPGAWTSTSTRWSTPATVPSCTPTP